MPPKEVKNSALKFNVQTLRRCRAVAYALERTIIDGDVARTQPSLASLSAPSVSAFKALKERHKCHFFAQVARV